MALLTYKPQNCTPWNKGKLVGQKPPLKLKEVWAIRIYLQITNRIRDLALFILAIDSKLRGCDLLKIRVYGYGPRGPHHFPFHHHTAEDRAASSIRVNEANVRFGSSPDR